MSRGATSRVDRATQKGVHGISALLGAGHTQHGGVKVREEEVDAGVEAGNWICGWGGGEEATAEAKGFWTITDGTKQVTQRMIR